MVEWISLIFLWSMAALQDNKPPQQAKPEPTAPFVEQTQRLFTFYPGGKIEIIASAPGSYKVMGWEKASVSIDFERIIYHLDPEQAIVLAGQYPIHVRYGQTSATIRTTAPPQSLATMEINAVLHIPKDRTDLKIQILKGDLTIGDISGWIEANIGEGSVEAKSLSGYASFLTKMGEVDVEMSGKRWIGHGFTAVTQKGSVGLRLPASYSAALQLETRGGDISVSFPEQLVEGESIPLKVLVKKNIRLLNATVGEGGSPIRLLTMSGNVTLSAIESQ